MSNRTIAGVIATLVGFQCVAAPVKADNPMGYRLLSAEEAATLPRGGATIGLDVGRAERVTSNGLTFDLLRVKAVRTGAPGAQAGFKPGDEIIAVDGLVFPTVAAFAAYIGSMDKGRQVSMDYIPANGGPGQAQRLVVKLGGGRKNSADQPHPGFTTVEKIAIGAGAAALIGCYEYGCLSRFKGKAASGAQPAPTGQP